jgi:beta-N-acetylhexosaminidase
MTSAFLRRAAYVIGIAVLGLVALHSKHPILYAIRGIETPLVIVLATAGVALAAARWRAARPGSRRRVAAGVALACLLPILAVTLANEAVFQRDRSQVLAAPAAARTLGPHFMVGFRDWREARTLAERGLIGGLYVTRHNVRGLAIGEIRRRIDALQAARAAAGLPPLLIAADQEGGPVAHLTPPLPAMPPLSSVIDLRVDPVLDPGLDARARRYGLEQGRALASAGINLNLGPVVDLRPAGGDSAFDAHTRVASRAIAERPELVSRVARAYGEGLAAAGVQPTLKHFPGLRGADADTHHSPARLQRTAAALEAEDWQPFRQAGGRDAALMLGHVTVPDLDPDLPASLSPTIVQGLLRGQWGHRGLLITDDLAMGAVYRRGICTAATQALEAGVDLLLISYDPDQFYRAMACVAKALERGDLALPDLAERRARVARLTETNKPGTAARTAAAAIDLPESRSPALHRGS